MGEMSSEFSPRRECISRINIINHFRRSDAERRKYYQIMLASGW
ncbi:hypothetical protein ACU8KH_01283 [Lachancea thermotolerans]